MKNFTSICSGLLLLALGVTGCSEEKDGSASWNSAFAEMSVNTTDLVMGENLAITFDVTGTEEGKNLLPMKISTSS